MRRLQIENTLAVLGDVYRYPLEVAGMNPYASPTFVAAGGERKLLGHAVRFLAWIVISTMLIAFTLYPVEPRLQPMRSALGWGNWLVPLMPFVLYELLCRASPHSTNTPLRLVESVGRCILTYVIPFYIFQFVLLFARPVFSSHRTIFATAFVCACASAMIFDLWAARRSTGGRLLDGISDS